MLCDLDFDFFRADAVTLDSLLLDGADGSCRAFLTEDRQLEPLLRPLAARLGETLLLSEVWQVLFPRCGVLISSAICGGTFAQRLRDAPAGRSWLLVEPVSMEFPLPCLSGQGRAVPRSSDTPAFYSPALCCQYTHFLRNNRGFFQLWDTEDTLKEKLRLAKDAGFLGYVLAPKKPEP